MAVEPDTCEGDVESGSPALSAQAAGPRAESETDLQLHSEFSNEETVQQPVYDSREQIAKQAKEQLAFKDPRLLRGSTVAQVLRGHARILANAPCTAACYDLSSQTAKIDTFISHNWSSSRWKKFLTLALHFNLGAAVAWALVVGLVMCALTACGLLPACLLERQVVSGIVEPDAEAQKLLRVGFWCQASGMATFVVVLLFGQEIGPVFGYRGPTVFLDKTCVHQTDNELKRRGIMSLAAFMGSSRSMVVLYSDMYLDRLWTVYELATFMSIFPQGMHHRDVGRLVIRPIFAAQVVLVGTLACGVQRLASQTALADFAYVLASAGLVWWVKGLFVLFIALAFQFWARKQAKILERVRSFDVHKATCLSEADRQLVLSGIALFSKHSGVVPHEAGQEETMVLFNTWVQQEVPRLFACSVGRVGLPYLQVVCMWLVWLLDALDEVGAAVARPEERRQRLIFALWAAVQALAYFPLCFGICTLLSRLPLKVPRLLCVLAAALNAAVTVMTFQGSAMLFEYLSKKAREPTEAGDAWLVVLLLFSAGSWAVTLIAYGVVPCPILAALRCAARRRKRGGGGEDTTTPDAAAV